MTEEKVYTAIGLMSGTSADGIDAALIKTDGKSFVKPLTAFSQRYEDGLRGKIRKCFGARDRGNPDVIEVERLLTQRHGEAVKKLMSKANLQPMDIDIIGFHGQTVFHDPDNKLTWQIGDGEVLAKQTGVDVVNGFRTRDVMAGGQGAPFLPLYHQARAKAEGLLEKAGGPIAVLNVGGVSNVTWIGKGKDDLIAFDTGPGNALMDDYIYTQLGQDYDEGGALAAKGEVQKNIVNSWMALPYFALPLPKSLDRNSWDVSAIEYLSHEDALATLSRFTVESVALAEKMLPEKPKLWMVTGGGRKNMHMMKNFETALDGEVKDIDEFGWDGDAVEAEGFAYLAVRSLLGLPLSLPKTTGVPAPQTGGFLHRAG